MPGTDAEEALLVATWLSARPFGKPGWQYPNAFITKDAVDNALGRPEQNTRSLIASLETQRERKRLRQRASQYLRDLQIAAVREQHEHNYQYPGVAEGKVICSGLST